MTIHAQRTKVVRVISPNLQNNGTPTSQAVDTLGYRQAKIIAHLGDTDIALSALKITECDTSGGTYTDITGLRVGTDAGIGGTTSSLPGSTDDNKFWEFDIDLRGRKRYLKAVLTVGSGSTGAYNTVLAVLSRPEDAPDTATERGCADVLRVP